METKPQTAEETRMTLLKKMHRMDWIRTAACLVTAVVAVAGALIFTPRVNALLNRLNSITSELAQVDFTGIARDMQELAGDMQELAEQSAVSMAEVTGEMSRVLQDIRKIDFDALSESVENLGAITGPMAKLFGKR